MGAGVGAGGASANCGAGAGSGAGGRSVGAAIRRERGASGGAGRTVGAAAAAIGGRRIAGAAAEVGGVRTGGVRTGGAAAISGAPAAGAAPGSNSLDFGAVEGASATARGAGGAGAREGLAIPRGGRSTRLAIDGSGPKLSSTDSSIVTRLRARASPLVTIARTIAIARVEATKASGRLGFEAVIRAAFGALSGAIGAVAGNRRTRMITLRFVEVATLSDPLVGDNAARKDSPLQNGIIL